ncbi:MAG: hypothetical protein ACQETE_10880 [Bacteroidota bacterium]
MKKWEYNSDQPDITDSIPAYRDIQEGLQELVLVGSARSEYWEDILYPQNFAPRSKHGRVRLWLDFILGYWLRKPYFELRTLVEIELTKHERDEQGLYLVNALNSSRFLSFIERTMYNMPHQPADIAMQTHRPPAFQFREADTFILKGQLSNKPDKIREYEVYSEMRSWKGPVCLPDQHKGLQTDKRLFVSAFEGRTKIVPFSEHLDTFEMNEQSNHPLLLHLLNSGYRAEEWQIRPQATHRRTKLMNYAQY